MENKTSSIPMTTVEMPQELDYVETELFLARIALDKMSNIRATEKEGARFVHLQTAMKYYGEKLTRSRVGRPSSGLTSENEDEVKSTREKIEEEIKYLNLSRKIERDYHIRPYVDF